MLRIFGEKAESEGAGASYSLPPNSLLLTRRTLYMTPAGTEVRKGGCSSG